MQNMDQQAFKEYKEIENMDKEKGTDMALTLDDGSKLYIDATTFFSNKDHMPFVSNTDDYLCDTRNIQLGIRISNDHLDKSRPEKKNKPLSNKEEKNSKIINSKIL